MPRAYSSGGRVARGSPARMPGGLPLPNRLYEISAKCRFRFQIIAGATGMKFGASIARSRTLVLTSKPDQKSRRRSCGISGGSTEAA